MKALLAIVVALASAACSHGSSGSSPSATAPVIENPVKHVVQPVTIAPELAGSSAPAVFEQMLCNRMFEYNQKLVMCADDVRVFLEHRREQAMLGGETGQLEDVLASLDAPRRVNLAASKSGESVTMTILLQDAKGVTLARIQKTLKSDGADVYERATEAAIEILKVK